MYKIRQIKYSSKSVSIQVYKIVNRKRVVVKHIGTSRSEEERLGLISLAQEVIEKLSKQLILFENPQTGKVLNIAQTDFIGVYYGFFYEVISKLIIQIGLNKIGNPFLLDLCIIRIF